MGLKHLKIPEVVITTPGGNFAVRGLCLDDVAYLIGRHGEQIQQLLAQFQADKHSELSSEAISAFAAPLLKQAPRIAAEVIACATGEVDEESVTVAQGLPFPIQIEAIQAVAKLTFEVAGGPKKLVESVIQIAQGTNGLLTDLMT